MTDFIDASATPSGVCDAGAESLGWLLYEYGVPELRTVRQWDELNHRITIQRLMRRWPDRRLRKLLQLLGCTEEEISTAVGSPVLQWQLALPDSIFERYQGLATSATKFDRGEYWRRMRRRFESASERCRERTENEAPRPAGWTKKMARRMERLQEKVDEPVIVFGTGSRIFHTEDGGAE